MNDFPPNRAPQPDDDDAYRAGEGSDAPPHNLPADDAVDEDPAGYGEAGSDDPLPFGAAPAHGDATPTTEGGDVPARSTAPTYEGWVSVFECGTDFEADLVRDRLDAQGLHAVVFTQRDHVFNLNVGDLAKVHVMVPPEHEAAGRAVAAARPPSDAELEQAAMDADPHAPDAHNAANEASLDSGMESINLSIPAESGDLDDPDDDSGDAPRNSDL